MPQQTPSTDHKARLHRPKPPMRELSRNRSWTSSWPPSATTHLPPLRTVPFGSSTPKKQNSNGPKKKLQAHGLHLSRQKTTFWRSATHLPTRPSRSTAPPAEAATPAEPEPISLAQVLQPDHPSLKDDVPNKWSAQYITTWAKQFDEAIQDSATEILKRLQSACAPSNSFKKQQRGMAFHSARSPARHSAACSNWWPSVLPWHVDLHSQLAKAPTYHATYIDRAEAIYALGLLHITALYTFPSNTFRSKQWRTRLTNLNIHPDTYTFSRFLSPNSVYIKLYFNSRDTQRQYHQHGHCYVGSTSIDISGREHNLDVLWGC